MILAARMGPMPKISVRVVPETSTSASMRQPRSAIFLSSVLTSRSTSEASRWRRRAEAPPLEPVSKPPKVSPADKRAGEGEEGHMYDRVAFPADAQAPVVMQPREGTLDDPTPLPEPRAVLGSPAGDGRFDAAAP